MEEADECMADGKLPRGFSPSYEPNDHIFPPQASLPSRPSSKGSRSRSKARPRKSDAPQVHPMLEQEAESCRHQQCCAASHSLV